MINVSNGLNAEWLIIRNICLSKHFALLILTLIFPFVTMAQTAQELSKLSKEKLIELATAKINEPSFRAADFTNVDVWLEEDVLTVSFEHIIQFIPKKGQYYYSVSVELPSGSTGRSIKGDGPDDEDIQFYDPAKFQDQIKFVFNAINNSDGEIGSIPEGKMPDGTMEIKEETGYYDISVDSYSTHSYYKIKKGSGKIYDAGHKHYYRDESSDSRRKKIY